MIYQDYQIKGLEKLANNSSIMDIYPMVERIEISRPDDQPYLEQGRELWNVDVFVNDPNIVDKESMFNNDLDVLYLTDYHLAHLLPYLGIDQKRPPHMDIVVWGVDGNSIFYGNPIFYWSHS
jgi:hypothetical protein